MSNRNLAAAALVAFLLVAGIGAAMSYFRNYSQARIGSGADGEFAGLAEYARSGGPSGPAPTPPAGKSLPDVKSMIDRLAARLETAPEDVRGWRMLGWSYFHTGFYEQAAIAYGKAVALDPSSAELKLSYEEAKAKAAKTDSAVPTGAAVHNGGDDVHVAQKSDVARPGAYDAAVRSMVDGLASRLEQSPRDAEGWTRLMRSRVVLGEREVAADAFRKALEIFKDDQVASSTLAAAAVELGLKAE